MKVKSWHCHLILVGLVLSAYYPCLSAGYNSVDDLKMVWDIESSGPIDIRQLFFPQGTLYYFRPLTILTYLFDRDFWGTIPSFMHLENILLHLCNTLLVYAITLKVLAAYRRSEYLTAFFAALIFALHPLATEPVCWISGRTDPLMALFLLLTTWLVISGFQKNSVVYFLYSGVALLLACLAKEVAVFLLPGLLSLIVFYPEEGITFLSRLRRRCIRLTLPIFAIAIYFLMRTYALSKDTGIDTAVKGVVVGDYDLINKIRVVLKVYGFYFKKTFIPWPLNFGIVDISNWYLLLGILLVFVLLLLAWRADLLGAFGLMAFFLLSPALLVPMGKMAWTPIAERYLYGSLAFCAPALTVMGKDAFARFPAFRSHVVQFGVWLLVLVPFFATTLHRAWIWQDNLRLYSDTVRKSPNFSPAKNELAAALINRGRLAEAELMLNESVDGGQSQNYSVDNLNLAQLMVERGDLEGSRELLLENMMPNSPNYYTSLQILLRINDQQVAAEPDKEKQLVMQKESLGWLHEQQRIRPQTFTLYRIGKLYMAMGDKEKAISVLKGISSAVPDDAYYRDALTTLLEKLEKNSL